MFTFFHKGLMLFVGLIVAIICIIIIVVLVNTLLSIDYMAVRNDFVNWLNNLIDNLRNAGA